MAGAGSGGSSGGSSGGKGGGKGGGKKTEKKEQKTVQTAPTVALSDFGQGRQTQIVGEKPAPVLVSATNKPSRTGNELKTERTTMRGPDALQLKQPTTITSTPSPEARMALESIRIQEANRAKGLPSYEGMSPEMAMAGLNFQASVSPNIVNNPEWQQAKLQIEQQLTQQLANQSFQNLPSEQLPQQPLEQQPQEKGFLLENVSTATGIAGGVAGSLLGPAGTVAGAGLGAGLGESVENIAMGDPLGKNVLKTAAIDAALTLTGLGVVKLIKYGARLLLPGGELMVPAVTKMAAGTSRVSEYTGFLTKQRGVLTSELASDTSGTVAKRIQGIDKALHKLKISEAVPKVIGGLEGTEKEFFTQATKKLGRESLNYFDETSFNVWKNPKTARAGLSYLNTLAQGAKNPRFVLASLVAMGSLSIGTGVYWFTQTGNDTGDTALQLAMMANEAKNSPNKEEVIRNIRELSNDLADPAILEGLNALNYPKAVARKISYANQYVNLIADNIASEGNNK